ncbi:GTPase ObgE [Candidatus Saccharibacteria bacterium]|nr:GTPase ObgE [Candidatus Saccharibacteria bacterium]MBI3338371.1 GTPase ObgE [Candidatus Saccharibacteria bacterium]
MFVDKAEVTLKAGSGGDGRVSFRHEKYIRLGGPDGGDGGDGGDIIFVASRNQNTLANFRYQRELIAQSGKPGDKRKKHGRSGTDTRVAVPVGTTVMLKSPKLDLRKAPPSPDQIISNANSSSDKTDLVGADLHREREISRKSSLNEHAQLLADLTVDGQEVILAKGGKGGFGNAHFVSSTRQAPQVAEKGEKGQEFSVTLELKMIADVGLIGLPNAGKSTLLASVSNAKPEIANYPFTTLTPNLGVVDIDDKSSLLIADIPGLIEGASQGKGLGDEFLRHVERTGVLLQLIDVYDEDIVESFKIVEGELKAYKIDLSKRPRIVALTKIEGLDDKIVANHIKTLKKALPKGVSVVAISSQSKQNISELLYKLKTIVDTERAKQPDEVNEVSSLPILTIENEEAWHVKKISRGYEITGKKIERFAARTDFANSAGVRRLRDIMKKMGIMHELTRQGIKTDDKIIFGNPSLGEIEFYWTDAKLPHLQTD